MLAVVSVAALTVLAGCTSKSGGTATPEAEKTTTTTGSSTSSQENGDAPAITAPELDLSKFAGPCDLLKPDQLATRGVTGKGSERSSPAGPTCQWRPDDRANGTSFSATLLEKSNGLDGVYENRAGMAVFEETEVGGYPAVNTDATDAKRGACSTAVGVAKGEGFLIQINVNDEKLPEYKNPCSVSGAIAETVVGNLKG